MVMPNRFVVQLAAMRNPNPKMSVTTAAMVKKDFTFIVILLQA
jgi:hypothetical protein